MKSSSRFLGIDVGTGSCKSILVDEQAKVLSFEVDECAGAEAHDRKRVITWADKWAVEQARAVAVSPTSMSLYQEAGCRVHGR